MVALWLMDRAGSALTPLEHFGPPAEQGVRVQAVADRWDMPLAGFRRAEAAEFRDYCARRLGATSVNIYLRSLGVMLHWAVGRELIAESPLKGLQRLDPRKATPGGKATAQRNAYSAEDVRVILEAAKAKDAELWRWCSMLAWTAMRPGALHQLTPGHIDLVRGVLRVPPIKGVDGHDIPIVPPLREHAEAHTAWTRGPLWYNRQVVAIVREAGIEIARPQYGFRHGFGTQAIEAGLPIRWVSRYLGHSSVTTTERWYDHSKLVAPLPPGPEIIAIRDSIRAGEGLAVL